MNKKIKLAVSASTAGIAAIGAVGAVLLGALPSDAATTHNVAASNATGLKPSSLSFVNARWWCEDGNWFGGKDCHIGAVVPKGWKVTSINHSDAKFTPKSGSYFLRVAQGPYDLTTKQAVAQKQKSLKGTKNLKVQGVATARSGGIVYSTIVYTYTDSAKHTRWVATRFQDAYSGGGSAGVEITVGGTVADKAGLTTVLARATTSAYLAG
ncbi:hypothetical protein OHA70_15825 [Kribbella sp. NBC_00382]|uniref:hypothetical protein n=1 Tax=Kribbella sp. NBC_00382 TaxID=2975967 RepID=UPI002E21F2B7